MPARPNVFEKEKKMPNTAVNIKMGQGLSITVEPDPNLAGIGTNSPGPSGNKELSTKGDITSIPRSYGSGQAIQNNGAVPGSSMGRAIDTKGDILANAGRSYGSGQDAMSAGCGAGDCPDGGM